MRSIWEIDIKDTMTRGLDALNSRALSTFANLERMQGRVESRMSQMGNTAVSAANQTSSSWSMVGAVLGGNLLTQAVNFGRQGVASMLALGGQQELIHAGYETMIRDIDLTKKTLSGLKEFADWSPFSSQDVLKFGQDLLVAGVRAEALQPTLSRLGDIAMGDANKMKGLSFVYGQVMTQGVARRQDLYQMMNAGLPIMRELESYTGKSGEALDKFISDGMVSAQVIDGVMNKLTSEGGRYYKSLMKGADTLPGQYNALMSSIENIALKTFEQMLPYIIDILGIGERILPVIARGLEGFVNIIGTSIQWLKEHRDLVKTVGIVVMGLVAAYAAYKIQILGYSILMKGLQAVEMAHLFYLGRKEGLTIRATLAQMGLNTAMLLSPFAWVVGGIAALTAGFIWAWNSSEKFRKGLFALWESAKQVFRNIGDFFKLIFDPISKAIDAFHRRDWAGMGKAVMQMTYNLTPVGMAANAYNFQKEGGFSKGVSEAWDKGKVMGAESFKKKDEVSSAKSYNEVAQLNNGFAAGGGGAESSISATGSGNGRNAGGSGVGGTQHRNVTITINGGLVKELHIATTNIQESYQKIREQVADVLIGVVRDSELAIAQNG